MIFLFSLSLLPEAESECRVCQPAPWMKQAATHSGQTGKNDCCRPAGQVPSDRKHSYFLCRGLPFSRFRWCLFPFGGSLFYGFSPWSFFLPNLPLFSFTSILRLSVSRISQSFSFWARQVADLVHSREVDHIIGVGEEISAAANRFEIQKDFFANTSELLNSGLLNQLHNEDLCNENSEYHDRIIALVNKNANLIRQRMKAA